MKLLVLVAALLAGCATGQSRDPNIDPATITSSTPRVDVIPADQVAYTFYAATKSPAPTVFLGHGCGGIVPIQTEDYKQDLLKWGYNVVVVDSWTPRGIKNSCKTSVPYYHPPARMAEFYEVVEKIKFNPAHNGRLGYIGWSHGGSLGLSLASQGRTFSAVVSYYPGCGPRATAGRTMKTPTLMHLANNDTWTPIKWCNDIDGNVLKMVHPGSGHAFDIRAPYRVYMGEVLEYNATADRTAREATRRFLEEFLR